MAQNQLTPNVTLAEATFSNTAKSLGIINTPTTDAQYENMKLLAANVLEPLYAHFGKANIGYSSFFRSEALNKKVGGSNTSDHALGRAVDLESKSSKVTNADIFNWAEANLNFDQLIWEFGTDKNPDWVHVGYRGPNNRHMVLNINKNKTVVQDAGTTPPKTFSPTAGKAAPINTITPPAGTGKAPVQNEVKGIVNRIEVVFEHSIELDELSIPGAPPTENEDNKVPKPEEVISVEYPLIKINDYIFGQSEIESLDIDCTDFLPTITLSVAMISQLFLAKEMPKDGDILSLAIRNKSDTLKMIRNDYVITSVHVQPNYSGAQKQPSLMTFYGELFVPGLKSQVGDKAYLGTSMEALKEYAHDNNMGFATNEYNTDDKQIWLRANIAGDLFIKSVIDHAWKDQDSFYDAWIDVYYNLNFVNLNMQLMSSEAEVDIATIATNLDKNTFFDGNTDVDKTMVMPKVFSNFQNARTSSFFINNWRPANRSSSITFQIGTKMTCEMFEHNKNLYEDSTKQKYWAIGVEPAYDKDKALKMILLRGRATQVNDAKNTDLKRANYPFVGLYEKFPWLGIQYTISNPDSDNSQWDGNHHRYYQLAKVQNLINNKEVEKLTVSIKVDGTNFNIIRGDKMPIVIMRSDPMDNTLIREEPVHDDTPDLFYSGWYIVKGFNLSWDGDNAGSVMSGFTQEFILARREWPAPLPIDAVKAEDTSPGASQSLTKP